MNVNSLSLTREEPSRENARRVVLLAFLLQQSWTLLPCIVFNAANRGLAHSSRPYYIQLVTTGSEPIIAGHFGISLVAHRHYEEVVESVDTLLVVGGEGALHTVDEGVLVWLRKMASKVRRLGSVCTGAFLLAAAGLLNGRRVTTHWAYAQALASRYPEVMVDPDPIWVQDGNVYTSAGVTAGMDLALALVEEDYGTDIALKVARALVLFLRRPGGQAQFSVSLSAQATAESRSSSCRCGWPTTLTPICRRVSCRTLCDEPAQLCSRLCARIRDNAGPLCREVTYRGRSPRIGANGQGYGRDSF